jgi:glycosyltransferase involved in cell wall biosynthesis
MQLTDGSRPSDSMSVSVIVPCRNESDNVMPLVDRMPRLGSHTELIFVDGDSTDGTVDCIREIISGRPECDIRVLAQGKDTGKAGAVFQGFDAARGDVVMILDADMAVAPEELPKFYDAVVLHGAGLANGTRFVYPMEAGAMHRLNSIGNRLFCNILSWIVGTKITDTLCGTKALLRRDWPRVKNARPLFGGHDPWGDFDLLMGAAYADLKIVDVPVRYRARVAGESKMHAFRHGVALTKTCLAGARQLKLRRNRP